MEKQAFDFEAFKKQGRKQVKTPIGAVDIATPRGRNGTFEPEIVAKRSKTLGVDLDRQIIALYARGASYGDIRDHLSEMYDLDVSPGVANPAHLPEITRSGTSNKSVLHLKGLEKL